MTKDKLACSGCDYRYIKKAKTSFGKLLSTNIALTYVSRNNESVELLIDVLRRWIKLGEL